MELFGFRWNYINEGNVHIVLQLIDTEYVLRLIKEDEIPVDIVDIRNSAMFVNHVMGPLLRDKSNNFQEVLELPDSALTELRKVLYDFRPEHRRFKSNLSRFTIRTLNLAMLSPKCATNFCVEIKPKEGFITSSCKPLSRCYYCLKQHLKLQLKQIQKKSSYCPIDLFSGDRKRMKLALVNLISNPQNNFKVFSNGKIIYQEHFNESSNQFDRIVKSMGIFKDTNIFLDFLVQTLLSCESECTTLTETPELTNELKKKEKCLETTHLHQLDNNNPTFLNKLLKVQKLSEVINLDMDNVKAHGKEYVHEILNQIQNLDLNLEPDRKTFYQNAHFLHLAMISAVAKDCSIMICFSPDYLEDHATIIVGSKRIPFKVSVTDLEPKSIDSLLKRKRTESKITDIYKKYLARDETQADR